MAVSLRKDDVLIQVLRETRELITKLDHEFQVELSGAYTRDITRGGEYVDFSVSEAYTLAGNVPLVALRSRY